MAVTGVITPVSQKAENCQIYQDIGGCTRKLQFCHFKSKLSCLDVNVVLSVIESAWNKLVKNFSGTL